MPKAPRKKPASGAHPLSSVLADVPDFPQRPGLPAKDSIISVTIPVKAATGAALAGGRVFRIIHTNEMDEYETGAASSTAFVLAARPTGDKFQGTARRAAKLSIASAAMEQFDDVKELIESLDEEEAMIDHEPEIGTEAKSNRVKEEKRNVRVRAFIYAASIENDNDFHLIVGRNPQRFPELYMTMELSGLPASTSSSFKKLKAARTAFKDFFNNNMDGNLPGLQYDFYDPPIPVKVEGSLFFDMSHATGSRPGPKSLKSRMPVIWEVHPITRMVFES